MTEFKLLILTNIPLFLKVYAFYFTCYKKLNAFLFFTVCSAIFRKMFLLRNFGD